MARAKARGGLWAALLVASSASAQEGPATPSPSASAAAPRASASTAPLLPLAIPASSATPPPAASTGAPAPSAGPAAQPAPAASAAPELGPEALPSERVHAARAALEDLRYDDAIADVRPLLKGNPRWRVPALEITAVAELILGHTTEAKTRISELYALAPSFALADPSLPPRVTGVFDAEAAQPHPRAVLLQLRADSVDRQGFDVVAGGETASVHLACRRDRLEPFVPFPTTARGELYHFRVPTGRTYQCFAVALDKDDLPLGRLGREASPFNAVPRPKPTDPPVYKRWYFWAIMLGAATTAGVTAGVIVQRSQANPPAPTSDLTVHWY
jgi:hypothetical protein